MKYIPIGLQCSVPEGIERANLRECAYPFDWFWTPSATTYNILNILINQGIESAIEYMTANYTYFNYLNNEHYISTHQNTVNQMNKLLRRRLSRLLNDIMSLDDMILIYADAANPDLNYYLDDIEYGTAANAFLIKIHDLIYPINKKIRIIYFCWPERKSDSTCIEYIQFDYRAHWNEVSEIIKNHLINTFIKP